MKVIKCIEADTTDTVDHSEVKLDIRVLSEGKVLSLVIIGEIYSHWKIHDGDLVTPEYAELIEVHAAITDLSIEDMQGNYIPSFNTEFSESSKELEELLKTYCYEG